MLIKFNDQQQRAINQAVDWFRKSAKPFFNLGGFAGCGKTTVARTIAELCCPDGDATYIAPTGKAAARLREKGCSNAMTLHRLIYRFKGTDASGRPIFDDRNALDFRPRLVICDEASMVSERQMHHLLQHGIPVLNLGDPGQLQPVGGRQFFRMDNLDVLLTKIERQGAGSLIVEAAQYVRQGGVLRVEGEDEGIRVRHGRASRSIVLEHTGDDYSQIVCSRNETRMTINQKVRDLYGFSGSLPQIGEKVQCRFNQHDAELMNGELGFVLDIDDGEIALDVGGRQIVAEFKPSMFNSEDDKGVGAFAHGYAITIHSSQGSEWKNVLMFDDITQRNTYSRLAYTGFTRAAEQLTIQI